MARKSDASPADALKRLVSSNGTIDVKARINDKARGVFDEALNSGMGFEGALGAIYVQAIEDYMGATPKRKRASRAKPAAPPPSE